MKFKDQYWLTPENIAASLGLPKDQGEIVRSVVPGEAAERAGLRQGDVILSVGGQMVTPDETVSFLIAEELKARRIPPERAARAAE